MKYSKPKSCTSCSADPVVHLSKVVDGKLVKLDCCAECPKAKAATSEIAWDLVDGEDGGLQPAKPRENQRACMGCGLTAADFKESGRLGCSRCYQSFSGQLEPMISKLHRGASHRGKIPGRGPVAMVWEEPETAAFKAPVQELEPAVVSEAQLEALRHKMQEHVKREEYEQAAALRDQIRELGGE